MSLTRLIEEKDQYTEDFLQSVVLNICGSSGVLRGLEIEEYQVGDEVFVNISPGSFVRNGVIYIIRDKIVGSESYSEHSLNITQFTDDPTLTGSTNRVGTGVVRLYVVETATDEDDPSILPVFETKLNPNGRDIIIGFRYIKAIAGDPDIDPFLGELVAGDPNDSEYREYVG